MIKEAYNTIRENVKDSVICSFNIAIEGDQEDNYRTRECVYLRDKSLTNDKLGMEHFIESSVPNIIDQIAYQASYALYTRNHKNPLISYYIDFQETETCYEVYLCTNVLGPTKTIRSQVQSLLDSQDIIEKEEFYTRQIVYIGFYPKIDLLDGKYHSEIIDTTTMLLKQFAKNPPHKIYYDLNFRELGNGNVDVSLRWVFIEKD